ncbi:hypothetical protein KZ838_21910, partial [Pseudomonas aeruginosa]|uniref:ComF family protein n=1 Tax=Pseudomonas aeruginosa TaxID=287 RepID=UPI00215607BB
TISGKLAKMVFEAMANGEGSADKIIEAKGLKQVTDSGAIEKMLGELLAEHLRQRYAEGLPRPARLLPVPLAPRRERRRGFNQAQQLAERLAGELDLRCDPHSLRRVLDTPAQQGLDATVRRRNLRHAFALAPASDVRGLHLALVDDVLTTGATTEHLSRLLRRAGAARVDVYCLARTPKPG